MKWPLVWRKTYDSILSDYNRHEDSYWKQAKLNITAQKRLVVLEKENADLKKKIEAYGGV